MTGRATVEVLVGRSDDRVRLRGLVVEVAEGRGGSVWVEGDAGIGKSALLAAGLAQAAELGCRCGGRQPARWASSFRCGHCWTVCVSIRGRAPPISTSRGCCAVKEFP